MKRRGWLAREKRASAGEAERRDYRNQRPSRHDRRVAVKRILKLKYNHRPSTHKRPYVSSREAAFAQRMAQFTLHCYFTFHVLPGRR